MPIGARNLNVLSMFALRIMKAVVGIVKEVTMNSTAITGDLIEIGDIVMITPILHPPMRIGVRKTGAWLRHGIRSLDKRREGRSSHVKRGL
jgi:hypothetical protein